MRIGLVSCTKSKLGEAAPARRLYEPSTLFRGARCHVERSCERWLILSAKHGLLDPDSVIAPYDETLTTAGAGARRAWSRRVLEQLRAELGDLGAHTFEIHAGAAYVSFGLKEGLVAAGARVEEPLAGLGIGRRLAFYRREGCL